MPDVLPSASEMALAARYLQHYGYAPDAVPGAPAPQTDALSVFQERTGLPVTGELDSATVEMIRRPRCGCKDAKRLEAELAKWRKNRLTYFIRSRVRGLTREQFDAAIRTAFDQWEACADIKFIEAASAQTADLIIDTGSGPADNFDGPSGTLAWAFLPFDGVSQLQMKFDLGEQWAIVGQGIRLLNVACHEFGHMLGLDHSRVASALMAPIYSVNVTKPQANDDVPRIQALYGKPVAAMPPSDPAPTCPTVCQGVRQALRVFNQVRHSQGDLTVPLTDDERAKARAAANACAGLQWLKIIQDILTKCPAPPPAAAVAGPCGGIAALIPLLGSAGQLLGLFCPQDPA